MSERVVRRLAKPDSLIVNSPYREPERYWKYDREKKEFLLIEGERRPAGYLQATPDSAAHDDPGIFRELPLVNIIRRRVNEWRAAEYPGVTATTRRLLDHWHNTDERQYPFFYCQLEAIETLIWLVEASPADVQGVHVPGDGGPFARYCTKLATGGGKTIVMAMAIAWQVCNKVAARQDARFAKHVLVVAPGLTVRNRLSVLKPDHPDGDYFKEFGIVPGGSMMDALRQGSVGVLNWHKLDWESDEQIAKRRGVDKRGAKSDEAYVRGVLREAGLPEGARNILVLNDEAHHAWRVPEGKKIPGVSRADAEEATKWVGGLDRVHKARGVLRCFDCSATPFVPTGKKSGDEQLFGWIVSDFGLNDAIESGLVKTPRIVVRDDAVPDVKTYKPKLYHIYPHVKDDLNGKREPHEPLPSLVTGAYYLLGRDWLATKEAWEKQGHEVPPVMISVANRTETAARIKYAFDHGNILIEELCDPERTLHIDSKVLESAEGQDEPVELDAAADDDDDGADDGPIRKLTKKEMGELLRRQVDTVGKAGEPGGPIQNVISVAMLTEGWDARTVTHIMGLRAFSSQLLCEQVIGRGLRRTSYDDFDGELYRPEYVNVFGIPFSFMPHEGGDAKPPPPPPPRTEIKPLQEREAEFEITWPQVLKIEVEYRPRLDLDWSKVPELELHASDIPQLAEIAPTVDNKADWSRVSAIDLRALAERFRYQRLAFEAVKTVAAGMADEWKGSPQNLVSQLLALVEQFLKSDCLRIEPELFHQQEMPRRLMLALRMTEIANHIAQAVRDQNVLVEGGKEQIVPVFDDSRPIRSTGDMLPWFTSKPCAPTCKSHINHCVYDSTWEATHAAVLDRSELVQAWAKNDHLGFEVWYTYGGVRKRFRPDFLVRLVDQRMLALETKGQDSPEQQTKRRYLAEWVRAVNGTGRFGEWMASVALSPDALKDVLHGLE